MNLFTRLFGKKAPVPAKPKTIENKLAEMEMQTSAEIISIALTHGEDTLRNAAINKLSYGADLLSLALASSPIASQPGVQRAAQQRVAQLIDEGAADFDKFCAQTTNKTALLAIAGFSNQTERLEQAFNSINDAEFTVKLVTDGPSARVRQLAAERIDDPVLLKQLIKDVRGKDKNVYKIIKRKCDVIQAQERIAVEAQASIQALADAIERHSHRPFDGIFTATLEHLNLQWNTVAAEAPQELKERVTQAIERGRDIISQHVRSVAEQAARATAIDNADLERQTILSEMRRLLASIWVVETDSLEAFKQTVPRQMTDSVERWHKTTAYKQPKSTDTSTFERLCKTIPELLQLLSERGTLQQQTAEFNNAIADQVVSEDKATSDKKITANYQTLKQTLEIKALLGDMELPEVVNTAEASLREWQKSREDQQAAAAMSLRHIGGLVRKASNSLSEGRSGQAAGLRRAIEEKLLDIKSVPAYLSNQIQQLDEKLKELQDWKSYAVAPKRIQLIEQMEALVSTPENQVDLDPNELADQIRRLQDEWKTISKGAADQSDAEWQKFHEAAQTAYQPCREYFAAQAKIRQDNLEKRQTLVAQLNEYETSQDWNNANWKEVAKVLRIAKQEWRSFSPTERAATKPIQENFDALMGKLQARLDTEFANNIEQKKTLISKAQQLLSYDDSRKALDGVKKLQADWKTIGMVPHQEDQQLWELFKQQCDAVYAKRQQEFTELSAELEANKEKALALCVEAEQLADLSGAALFESAKRIAPLREAFNAIGELPKASDGELSGRFRRALERHEINIAQQRARDKERSWENLLDANNAVRLYQLTVAENASQSDIETSKQAARTLIESVQQWPKGGLQALESKFSNITAVNLDHNEAELRMLCIRAEILTVTATPPEDQDLRMTYQVQSLLQDFGKAPKANKEELEAMVFEWLAIGATRTPVYMELLTRFKQCLLNAQGSNAS